MQRVLGGSTRVMMLHLDCSKIRKEAQLIEPQQPTNHTTPTRQPQRYPVVGDTQNNVLVIDKTVFNTGMEALLYHGVAADNADRQLTGRVALRSFSLILVTPTSSLLIE